MRDILHFSIPSFPVAVARVVDPSLRQRPLVIAPGHSERALIQSASVEAKCEGVCEGMPVYRARRFCPALRVLDPDPARVDRAMQALVRLTAAYTPLWEPERSGRLYLDLTGSSRLLGPGRDVAARLEKEILARLRLRGAVGVAGSKLVSRIASGYLERPGVCDVLRGSEQSFIGPLAVSVLPGVGATRSETLLCELNLQRVEELAALSLAQLRLVFGAFAPLLQQRSRGIDPSPVHPPRRSDEVTEESVLPREENDDLLLRAELCRLVEGCGFRLRRLGKGARRMSLRIHYADGAGEEGSARLPVAEDGDHPLLAAAEELFGRTCRRRVRVKGMRLACSDLALPDRQLDLFCAPQAAPRELALQQALDTLRQRHGMEVVQRGQGFKAGGD